MIRAVVAALGIVVTSTSTSTNPPDGTRSYAAVYEMDDAANASITRETLTVHHASGRTYVLVTDATGAASGFTATLAPDGEVENEPHDAALVCYNMAMSLLDQRARNPRGQLSLVLSVRGGFARIPLVPKNGATPATDIAAIGHVGGTILDTRVDTKDGLIADAAFEELNVAGNPARVVGRTLCSLATSTEGTHVDRLIQRS